MPFLVVGLPITRQIRAGFIRTLFLPQVTTAGAGVL